MRWRGRRAPRRRLWLPHRLSFPGAWGEGCPGREPRDQVEVGRQEPGHMVVGLVVKGEVPRSWALEGLGNMPWDVVSDWLGRSAG